MTTGAGLTLLRNARRVAEEIRVLYVGEAAPDLVSLPPKDVAACLAALDGDAPLPADLFDALRDHTADELSRTNLGPFLVEERRRDLEAELLRTDRARRRSGTSPKILASSPRRKLVARVGRPRDTRAAGEIGSRARAPRGTRRTPSGAPTGRRRRSRRFVKPALQHPAPRGLSDGAARSGEPRRWHGECLVQRPAARP